MIMFKLLNFLFKLFVIQPLGVFVLCLREWYTNDRKKVSTWLKLPLLFTAPIAAAIIVILCFIFERGEIEQFDEEKNGYDYVFTEGRKLLVFLIKFLTIPVISQYYVIRYIIGNWKYESFLTRCFYPFIILVSCIGYFLFGYLLFLCNQHLYEIIEIYEQKRTFY